MTRFGVVAVNRDRVPDLHSNEEPQPDPDDSFLGVPMTLRWIT